MENSRPDHEAPHRARSFCNAPASAAWQPAIVAPAAGIRVRARGHVWRVRRVDHHAGCRVLHLIGQVEPPLGPACTLIDPADRVRMVAARARWTRAGLARGAARLASAVAATTFAGDRHALTTWLTWRPWQAAAADVLTSGVGTRVLLADAVGLGKTVQAGLALVSLRAAGELRRVLILTPAGLREQWAHELDRFFGWAVRLATPAALRHARRGLPADINPWELPGTTIASVDFVKRPEILAAASTATWDALVVDEAHALGTDSHRHAATEALARSSRHVLLLTATPHAGRDDEFHRLCDLGRLPGDDRPIVLVQRTAADVGEWSVRRIRVARVGLGASELRLHRQLHVYATTVWQEDAVHTSAARLAMTVLLKRAASSAHALLCSLQRRLRLLEDGKAAHAAQVPLPFDDAGEREDGDLAADGILAAPGLGDRAGECRLIQRLIDAARAASSVESKLARVRRLLTRVREPAVVFTEYRDTLDRAVEMLGPCGPTVILHGGLPPRERRAALDAFTSRRARLLITTDVASEGLNLQATCRLVISLELPWNPVRLEQRIGRVDRIGQRRPVHAVHVVARRTAEAHVLGRLTNRVRTIRRALGGESRTLALPDSVLAAGALGLAAVEEPSPGVDRAILMRWSPDADFDRACRRLDAARQLAAAARERLRSAAVHGRPPLVRVRPRLRRRLGLAPGLLFLFAVEQPTPDGGIAARAVVPVHVELAMSVFGRVSCGALALALAPLAHDAALRHVAPALARERARHRAWVRCAVAREAALLSAVDVRERGEAFGLQPGLFDRRIVIEAARQDAGREARRRQRRERLERLVRQADDGPAPRVEPLLALVLR